jgi:hypothetical protein
MLFYGIGVTFLNNTEILSEDLFVQAVENFEEFLVLIFGGCWEGCTGEFRKKLKKDENVAILSYMYLKYSFLKVCKGIYSIIRRKTTGLLFGKIWVDLFVEMIEKMDLTYQGQLVWEALERSSNKQDSHKIQKDTNLIKNKLNDNSTKQVCFGFLGKELGVHSIGCTKANCQRLHNEVFSCKKTFILEQLQGNEVEPDLIKAVANSDKFL